METLKFKTNIKCTGCLAKVTPSLNETVGENNWKVDLEAPERTLIIENLTPESQVVAAVKEAGFEAEKI